MRLYEPNTSSVSKTCVSTISGTPHVQRFRTIRPGFPSHSLQRWSSFAIKAMPRAQIEASEWISPRPVKRNWSCRTTKGINSRLPRSVHLHARVSPLCHALLQWQRAVGFDFPLPVKGRRTARYRCRIGARPGRHLSSRVQIYLSRHQARKYPAGRWGSLDPLGFRTDFQVLLIWKL